MEQLRAFLHQRPGPVHLW